MKTTRFERITTKPVTIEQQVREVVEVPTIACDVPPRVEVTNWGPDGGNGNELVLLNGVLLAGARLHSYEETRDSFPSLCGSVYGALRNRLTILLPYGKLMLENVNLVTTSTAAPCQVEWKAKHDPLGSSTCPCCASIREAVVRGVTLSTNSYTCPQHGRLV